MGLAIDDDDDDDDLDDAKMTMMMMHCDCKLCLPLNCAFPVSTGVQAKNMIQPQQVPFFPMFCCVLLYCVIVQYI